ncbi:Uncharacterised protein [Yersinia pseudotuberculosis]|nr:hypothetical protein [Yersinia pseudotuberculosis]SUQ17618.1 Uncharacterised protein [Yersinia pseudotuberculosis]
MAHEITLEKAEKMAYQAELVCLLLESYPMNYRVVTSQPLQAY